MSGKDKMFIGLDLGDRYAHFCILGSDGEVLDEGRVQASRYLATIGFAWVSEPSAACLALETVVGLSSAVSCGTSPITVPQGDSPSPRRTVSGA
jgi:hypothetical protein